MKVTFFSSVLNHHQIEFCDEMYTKLGNGFKFVSTMEMEEQRKNLKYYEYERPYKIRMYTSEEERDKGNDLFQESDAVILGVNMPVQLRKRLKKGKITFLYRERIFKAAPSMYKYLRSLAYFVKEYWAFRGTPFYVLAASAYTLKDHKSLGMFGNKTFSWGYFPPCKIYNEDVLMGKKSKDKVNIFWAGRFINWKNPQLVIDAAEILREHNVNFSIDMVGNGENEDSIKALVKEKNLQEYIEFHGAMSQEDVSEYMERANIYLFTSNREEGFGAVLTEAMNSGCAVVSSATAGSTKLLINNGENGLMYEHDSSQELCEKTLYLAENPEAAKEIGLNAYRTVRDVQNAKVAAERFIHVLDAMLNKKEIPQYSQGPMRKMG